MSTSTYYTLITSPATTNAAAIADRRASMMSPSSSTAASSISSDSNSSLFNSLTNTLSSSSSSSSSSTPSSTINTNHRYQLYRQPSRDSALIRKQPYESGDERHSHQKQSYQHLGQSFQACTLHSLEPKPLKPYRTNNEYLEAMREDLADWFNRLYPDLDLTADNFFQHLETGSVICRHANSVTQMGRNYMMDTHTASFSPPPPTSASSSPTPTPNLYSLPCQRPLRQSPSIVSRRLSSPKSSINWFQVKLIPYKKDANPGTFHARDNICQFILWCRSLNILDCLLFETDDLVARKNEKSFILCLLEVARIGFKVGMPTPLIIQLEQEIDREIENEAKLQRELEISRKNQDTDNNNIVDSFADEYEQGSCRNETADALVNKQEAIGVEGCEENQLQPETQSSVKDEKSDAGSDEQNLGPKPQVITNDLLSLHERVVQLLCLCTCPTQFPMVRVGDNGKYKVGDKLIIFVRILRRHIMVRVGGGWQELSEFLRVKDPCRSRSPSSHLNSQCKDVTLSQPRSRLGESSRNLDYRGQRLISNSASMSWLS